MQYARCIAFTCLIAGCATDASSPEELTPDAPIPMASGSYRSAYRVPVEPALEAAALYDVDHVEWTVVGSTAALHYDLPVGLVGGKLDVTFTGTVAPGATTVELRSAQGTGSCVATATTLTCHELFENLGALPIDALVVEQAAAAEYAGPVIDRKRVANQFASEPIGFVDLRLDQPVVEDHEED